MDISYASSFVIIDREVVEVKNPNELLSSLIATSAIVSVLRDGQYRFLKINRLHRKTLASVDETLEISDFLENHLTDLMYDTLVIETPFPIKSLLTGRFNNRVEVTDPHKSCHIEYTSIRTPDIRNSLNLKDWMNDIVISCEGEDLSNSLISINGILHRTIHFGGELFVSQGYTNMKTSNMYEMSRIDTSMIGGHTVVPITEDMILNTEDEKLSNGARLKLPDGHTFKDKTVLLVMHGKLFILDDYYKVTGENTLKVNTNKFDIKHFIINHPLTRWSKAYRSSSLFSLDSDVVANENALPEALPSDSPLYTDFIDENGVIPASYLSGDQIFKDLLISRHSFIVIINNANVFKRSFGMDPFLSPGSYQVKSEGTPRGILMYNDMWTFPYTIMSSSSRYHTLNIHARRLKKDVTKTMINPSTIPAPWHLRNLKDDVPKIQLIELYAP